MRILLVLVGLIALAMGLLWVGQGLGIIMWPATSFMLRQIQWAYYGGALALVGLIILWRAGRSG